MHPFRLFFSFYGRLSRARFWLLAILWGIVGPIVLTLIIGITALVAGRSLTEEAFDSEKIVDLILGYSVLFVGLAVAGTAFFAGGLSIGVRRLHDRNKSGWWILPLYVVPFLIGTISNQTSDDLWGLGLALVGLILWLWGLVELGFLRGTVGPNRFGLDPLPH
jgi:uncharacterized membrane protein YhaH (DUF805 family)